MSSTTAWRRPMIRLTSVDFPTFGRPTTATTGAGPSGWSDSLVTAFLSPDPLAPSALPRPLASPRSDAPSSPVTAFLSPDPLARSVTNRSDQRAQPGDHLVDAEARGVQFDSVRGFGERAGGPTGVDPVAPRQVGHGPVQVRGGLGAAPVGPGVHGSRQVDLGVRLRRHDGTDIPPLHDDPRR